MVWWITAPFVAAVLIFNIFYAVSPKRPVRFVGKDIDDEAYLESVEHELNWWFKCWIVLTVVEVVFCGGVPIVWLLLGSSKVYAEFGLPVIHVFVSSLLAVLALAKLGLYLLRGDRRRLFIPILQVLWSVAIVNRGQIIIAMIQCVVLWLCLRGANFKVLLRTALTLIVTILLFGYVGDARTGAASFRNLAQPSQNYPDWLPSGVLWVYVYITSPLGNLVNTSFTSTSSHDILFPRTIFALFPNPIRDAIYGKDFGLESMGNLVSENLNVSSAYIGPLKDNGYIGIACFSLLLGIMAAYSWKKRRKFRNQLLYAIVAECIVLTVFWNFLFYTPFLGQIFWIFFLFRQRKTHIFALPKRLPASVAPIESAIVSPLYPYQEVPLD